MPQSFAISSNRVVTPGGVMPAAVLIADGNITDVVQKDAVPSGYPVQDVGDLVVMPGLIDTHVHINEPRPGEQWEGFETATKSAAAGGITTLVDMPLNSLPVTTTLNALKKKLDAAEGKLFVDCGIYAGLIPGNANQLPGMIEAGVLGVKAFLTHSGIDEFPNATENDLRAAMPIIAESGLPLLVHAELDTIPRHPERSRGVANEHMTGFDCAQPDVVTNPKLYSSYLASRPRQWEQNAIELMIRLCREYNCRTHIVHLSSADAVPALKQARDKGLPITVETCPHYLYFTAEEIPDGDTRFKCAPPIRERENCERLWNALDDGVIDFVVSDHSPCPPNMKLLAEGDFQKAWGGIASLQLGLSIIWTEAKRKGHSIERVAEWMCHQPAELVGLGERKGRIASGFDADIVVWNPESEFTVKPEILHHRHTVTPYEGRKLFGKVEMTFLRGTLAYNRGSFEKPTGMPLLRQPAPVINEKRSRTIATK